VKSTFKLAIQIGAAVNGSFKTAVRGSQVQLNQLGGTLKKLRSQQQAIGKFELAETNLGKARVAYNAAAKEVMRLRKEMAATDQPSKKLIQSFESAKQKAASLSTKLGTQKDKLRQIRRELDGAGIDTRQLASENQRLGSTLDRLNTKYKKLTQAMRAQEAVKAQRANLRGQLFDAVALGTTITAPVKVAVDFEQSVAKLGAITRADDQSLQSLEMTARKLGETTLFTASQSAEAMTFLGMAGFTTNQVLAATPGMMNLAQAAGSDLAETADIASNILSGFSLEARQMGRVGDVLSATFTSSNTTLQMLGDTLKYAAPVASATGASLEEVAAMAGLLGNVGIQGSMAGTALRAAFLRLSAPPKMAADAIAELGLSVKDADGNLRPIPEILKEIGAATESMGSAEQAEVIKKLFGSEAAAGMTELLKQAGTGALDDYIAQLKQAKGTTDDMARKMGSTTSGALKRLGSAMESMAISLGNVLLPTVAAGAEVFASFASWVSKTSQEYPFLSKVVVGATAGLIILKVTAIAGAYAFTFLKGGVLTLVTAYRTLSAGLALAQLGMTRMNVLAGLSAARMGIVTAAQWALNIAMTANPIGLIVAGIAALAGAAYLLFQNWGPIGEFFGNLWQGVKEITSAAVDWIVGKLEFLGKPMEMLGKAWDTVTGWFDDEDETRSRPKKSIGQLTRSTVGTALVASTPVMAAAPSPDLPDVVQQSRAPVEQVIRIDAPITIHTQLGMDARAIALEVQKALEQQKDRAMSDRRSALFDEAG
jgi:TP901 family phage tail tape measure protein